MYYATLFQDHKMKIDIHEAEQMKLLANARENKAADFVPLDKLVAKHTLDERHPYTHYCKEYQLEPENFLNDPFKFYGGYVRLSTQEKEMHTESISVQFYKDLNREIETQVEHLTCEVETLKGFNTELQDTVDWQKQQVDALL